jgi:prepilin-type processing-associated H-X9-DG protein
MLSQNHLKQLGIAFHNYGSSYDQLPSPGADSAFGFSVQAKLLPFIEQDNLDKLIDYRQQLFVGRGGSLTLNPVQANAARTVLKVLLSPSDGQKPLFDAYNGAVMAGTNYVVNTGTGLGSFYDTRFPTDGVFWYGSKVGFRDLRDGTSNTILMSETLLGLGFDTPGPQPADPRRQYANLSSSRGISSAPPGGVIPPLAPLDHRTASSWRGNRGGAWIWGLAPTTTFNTYLPPNSKNPDLAAHGMGWFAARSAHPGGVNVLLGDGSVRFVGEGIELNLWRGLSTRAGGEVLAGDF